MINTLPPVKAVGSPDTLKITYNDGSTLSVPYFDYAGTVAFLALEEEVASFEVVPYIGE